MNNLSANKSIYDIIIRIFILIFIIGWCFMIMYPFVSIILWSLILAMAMYPLHHKFSAKMGGKPKLASFIMIFSILAILILPAGLMTDKLVDEVKTLKIAYDEGNLSIPPPSESVKEWPLIGNNLYDFWYSSSVQLEKTILKYKEQLIDFGSKAAKGALSTVGGIFQMMISLIIAGILLVFGGIGESLRKFFRKLAGDKGDEFADIVIKTVGNVVKGVLGVALILALLHGILFTLAGIPYAGIWTLLIFILTVLQIPAVFITLPIIIYMFTVKEPVPAIVWSILLVIAGLSDNFLKPILLGKGAAVPMLVIFIGVIGGFMLSGFIGLFTGAIIMSLGYKLFIGWMNANNEVA